MTSDIIHAIPVPACLVTEADLLADANDPFRTLFPRMQIGRSLLTVLRQPDLLALVEDVKRGRASDAVELTVPGQAKGVYRATAGMLGQRVLICLQDLNETATAIEVRRNFIADMSHEMKTPLTAISGILETSQGDPAALEHFLPALSAEVDRMKRLVADLLTLSHVESNEKRTPTQDIVLQPVVEEVCAALAVLAKDRDMRIATTLPGDPLRFQGDPDEISRAIKNLVENGLRYGVPGGGVRVSVSGCEMDTKSGMNGVRIVVENDGPGVEGHHIPRLTERFYRVDSHRSRDSGGSGLGLAIVKHIVHHHRGRMTISSAANQGFRVALMFPSKQDLS